MEAEPTYYDTSNSSEDNSTHFEKNIIYGFICVVSVFGLVGNGIVIWLLGFRMKRNPMTTYILNLAVADFGVLISSVSLEVLSFVEIQFSATSLLYLFLMTYGLFHCFYSTSQFLLTTISIDRCVSVLFPLWYRCHRPEKLTTVLCALIWIFCFLVQGSCITSFIFTSFTTVPPIFYAFLVNAVVCLPLITVSTLILFIRFCFKSQQRRRKKLFIVILLTLFFFLFFAFPLNVIYLIDFNDMYSISFDYYYVIEYGFLCASLNSFVNPLLYFLVGRKKRSPFSLNMKLILRRVFMEEEEEACTEEPETQL